MNSKLSHIWLLTLAVLGLVIAPAIAAVAMANEDLQAAREHFRSAEKHLEEAERDAEAKQLLAPDPVEYRETLDAAIDRVGGVEEGLDRRADANESDWQTVDWLTGLIGITGVAGAAGVAWKRRQKALNGTPPA